MKNILVSAFILLLSALIFLLGFYLDDDPRPTNNFTPIFEYAMMTFIIFILLMIGYFVFNFLYRKIKVLLIQLK
jgi:hypothetical protein